MKNRSFRERLGFAVSGMRFGWIRERSFRTQSLGVIVAMIGLILLRPAPLWWAIVAIVIGLIMALELLNSAMEGVIDLLHPDLHPEIRVIKDMVAGAVLIGTIAALVVATALLVSIA